MAGRRLDPKEQALWNRVTASVRPLPAPVPPLEPLAPKTPPTVRTSASLPPPSAITPHPIKYSAPQPPRPRRSFHQAATLDGHWDRRLRKGLVRPDLSIDLHGHSLASAETLLDQTLGRALMRGARVLLVVAGRLRPGADRLPQMQGLPRPRGAIRAALPDWLAASPYADQIVALRPAHVSHGGAGAVYVILRRSRDED